MHRHILALRTLLRLLLTVALSLSGVLLVSPAAQAADIGYVGPSYGDPAANTGTIAPTAEKPESRLWFAEGRWWGALYNARTNDFDVYGYDVVKHTWTDTGSVIEARQKVWMDVLWDAKRGRLFVVSTGQGRTPTNLEVSSYRYDAATGTWPQTVKPVAVDNGWMYSPVIALDSTGTLWVTYTVDTRVMIAHSTAADGSTWTAPYQLPTPNGESTVSFDPLKDPKQPSSDISTVIAFDGNKIGVLWSNQVTMKIYWASHNDGDPDNVWSLDTAFAAPKGADDHLNVKAIQGDKAGRVFAVAKTSNTALSSTLIHVLVLDNKGNWSDHQYAKVSDDVTRAMLMLDEEHRDVYVFAAGPCCNGGTIYYKKASMDTVTFGAGRGTPFISSSVNQNLNNPSSTKQNVSSKTGLLVLAGDDVTRTYMDNYLTLDTTPPDTTITSEPAASSTDTTAGFAFTSSEPGSTFTCTVDGGKPQPCTSPAKYAGLATGPHTFAVAATDASGNTDPTPASYSWTVVAPPDTTAPDTTITTHPASTTTSTSAAFGLASSEAGSTFTCSLDGGTPQPCTSPTDYAGLAVGQHTFSVAATDASGNTDPTPASYGWTVQATPAPVPVPAPKAFSDDFRSRGFTAGGWAVQRRGDAIARVALGAVLRHNPGAVLTTDGRRRSKASILKRLPAAEGTVAISWDAVVRRDGPRGQRMALGKVYDSRGRQVLSIERTAKTGRLAIREMDGRTYLARGIRLRQVVHLTLVAHQNTGGWDRWVLRVDGRRVKADRRANLGADLLQAVRFGENQRRNSTVYRVDNVAVRW